MFLFLNDMHSPFWDKIMWFISDKESWYPLYLLIIIYIIYKYRWHSIMLLFFIALLIFFSDQGSVQLFKEVFKRLRPCHEPAIKEMVHIVNNKCGGQYGFISSHASNSFAIAAFLGVVFNRRWFAWSILGWAVVVSYSRIYLGVHYPLDIIFGGIFGALLGVIIAKLYFIADKKCFAINKC